MTEMPIKPHETLIATPRPGDFPLGSPQSRAAVRMKLAKIRTAQPRVTYVMYVPRPNRDPMRYHFTPWAGDPENGFQRFAFGPSAWLDPGDPAPVCPDCEKPFRKQQEVLGKISYVGDCVEAHLPERGKANLTDVPRPQRDVYIPDIGPGDPIPDLCALANGNGASGNGHRPQE